MLLSVFWGVSSAVLPDGAGCSSATLNAFALSVAVVCASAAADHTEGVSDCDMLVHTAASCRSSQFKDF